MKALFIILFFIALIYLGLGIIARFVHCKNTSTVFKWDKENVMYILTWPKHL